MNIKRSPRATSAVDLRIQSPQIQIDQSSR